MELVQEELHYGYLAEDCMWHMVVLIVKKDGRGLSVIGIVDVLCKTTMGIINRRLTSEISYHDMLHGFWGGFGTGTATLEANLIQQLTTMR